MTSFFGPKTNPAEDQPAIWETFESLKTTSESEEMTDQVKPLILLRKWMSVIVESILLHFEYPKLFNVTIKLILQFNSFLISFIMTVEACQSD
jgi:hypothetical protein